MSLSVNVKSLVLQVDAGLVSEVVIAIHCYLVRVPTSFCDGAVYVKYSFHRACLRASCSLFARGLSSRYVPAPWKKSTESLTILRAIEVSLSLHWPEFAELFSTCQYNLNLDCRL